MRSGIDLAVQIVDLGIKITCTGICHSAGAKLRLAAQFVTRQISSIVQGMCRFQQLGGKKIEYRLGIGVITVLRRVATHENNIRNTQSRSTEDTGLDRKAVFVARRHLHNRFDPVIQQQMTYRNRIHGHTGGVGFSQVNGANMRLK